MSGLYRSYGGAAVRAGLQRPKRAEPKAPRAFPPAAGIEIPPSRAAAPVTSWRREDEDAALDRILLSLEDSICRLIDCPGGSGPGVDRYLVRKAKRIRQMNAQCEALFGRQFQNAPMNMLIELFVASASGEKTLVKNLCLASSVSQSTALRWITRLVLLGLIARCGDETDARRSLIELTAKGRDVLSRFLAGT